VEKILLVDGFSILNRAFYALPPLTTASGVHTGAIFGFMNILTRFLDEEKPAYVTVAWDLPVPTFRHERYGAYKGTRRTMPDELREQVPTLKNLLAKMNLPAAECAGYEADDIIGTLAVRAQAEGLHPVIVSGDKDLLQLATDTICIRLPKTKAGKTEVETYFAADVLAKFGVSPAAYIDVKALMGDSSDNIPGVPGIGEVTATKIIVAYGTLENAIAHAAEIKPKKASENLAEFAEQARISQMLATIVTDVPVELARNRVADIWNADALEEAKLLELKQLVRRFATNAGGGGGEAASTPSTHAPKLTTQIIETAAEAEKLFAQLANDPQETSFFALWEADTLAGIAITTAGLSSYYIPAEFVHLAKAWLECDVPKIAHDTKKERRHFRALGIQVNNFVFDAMLAAYAYDALNAEKTLDELAFTHLGETLPTEESLLANKGKRAADKKSFSDLLPQALSDYASANAYALARLVPILRRQMTEQRALYHDIELPLSMVLADMEQIGICVNRGILTQNSDAMADKMAELTAKIYEEAGQEFNIQSPSQLGSILFEKLGLRGGKKTKQGYSTAADVLEKLRPLHPIIGLVLEYRTYAKLKSTYIDGLLPLIRPETSRIHSTFRQALTATGRLSSAEPNLQNIPVRTQMGRELRKAFVPKAGCVFVDADYSQIELRVLAHMSGDPVLIQAFRENADIHRLTASQVLGIAPEAVTPEQRSNAKAVNFGIVYGISAFGLADDLGIPQWEAEDYIQGYFAQYPKVKAFMNDCVTRASETGYATTLFGRRRALTELKSHNHNIRQFGARVAMNMPIQGTAADLIKIAMIRVAARLQAEKLDARLILQVHDELLLEVPHNEVEAVQALVRTEMESAAQLDVPLVADVHSGESWYDTK